MESPRFGIIIRVNDLDACRRFYRCVLELGDPALDSAFAVEFRLTPEISLYLEQTAAPYLTHNGDATALVLEYNTQQELDDLRTRLDNAGLPLAPTPETRGAGRYFRGCDPEGNPFWAGLC